MAPCTQTRHTQSSAGPTLASSYLRKQRSPHLRALLQRLFVFAVQSKFSSFHIVFLFATYIAECADQQVCDSVFYLDPVDTVDPVDAVDLL